MDYYSNYDTYSYTTTSTVTSAVAGVVLIFSLVAMIASVLMIIGLWKMFSYKFKQFARHQQQSCVFAFAVGHRQIHIDARQVKQAGEPRNDKKQMQEFKPQIHCRQPEKKARIVPAGRLGPHSRFQAVGTCGGGKRENKK